MINKDQLAELQSLNRDELYAIETTPLPYDPPSRPINIPDINPLYDSLKSLAMDASGYNPDEYQRRKEWALKVGLPVLAVTDMPELEKLSEDPYDDYLLKRLAEDTPDMAKHLASSLNNMILSSDDLEGKTEYAKELARIARSTVVPWTTTRYRRALPSRKDWIESGQYENPILNQMLHSYMAGLYRTKATELGGKVFEEEIGRRGYYPPSIYDDILVPLIAANSHGLIEGMTAQERHEEYMRLYEHHASKVDTDHNFFEKMLIRPFEYFGQRGSWALEGVNWATWGMLLGGALATVTGIGAPVGIGMLGAGLGLGAATVVGLPAVFAQVGRFNAMRLSEYYSNVMEGLDRKDIYGESLPREDILNHAWYASWGQAATEYMGDILFRAMLPVKWKVNGWYARGMSKTAEVFTHSPLWRTVLNRSVKTASAIVGEMVEEVAQGAIWELWSRSLRFGSDQTFIEQSFVSDIMEGPWQEGKEAFFSFALPMLFGLGGNLYYDFQAANNVSRIRAYYDTIAERVPSLKSAQRDPSTVGPEVQDLAENSGVGGVVTIGRRYFREYFQSQGIDPEQAARELGVEEEYKEDLPSDLGAWEEPVIDEKTGEEIKELKYDEAVLNIPAGVYAEKIVMAGHHEGLKMDITTEDNPISERMLRSQQQELKDQIASIEADIREEIGEGQRLREKARVKIVEAKPDVDPKVLEDQSIVATRLAVTLSQRVTDATPDELLDKVYMRGDKVAIEMPIDNQTVLEQFFGPKAEVVHPETFKKVQAMVDQGKTRDEIYAETGWWEIIPGQWSFEIDDSKAKWILNQSSTGKLEHAISFPELFKAYPQLRDVDVRYIQSNDIDDMSGYYDETNNELVVIAYNRDQARSIALHEIQHVIQKQENFARGASGELARALQMGYPNLQEWAEDINELIEEHNEIIHMMEDLRTKKTEGWKKKFDELAERVASLHSLIEDMQKTPEGTYEKYLSFAGEAESRLVQYRQKSEHKALKPWEALEQMLRAEGVLRGDMTVQDALTIHYGGLISNMLKNLDELAMSGPHRSTRVPTKVNGKNKNGDKVLVTSLEAAKEDMVYLTKAVQALMEEPGLAVEGETIEEQTELLVKRLKDNLSFIYNLVPPELAERTRQWYEGANALVEKLRTKYGVSTVEQAAAMVAILSARTDWFINITNAERIIASVTSQEVLDKPFDNEMLAVLFATPLDKERETPEKWMGKTLREVLSTGNNLDVAIWIRAWDEAYNNYGYASITTTGEFGDVVTKNDTEATKMTWQSYGNIAKAVSVFMDGSAENIDVNLGKEMKVRNFFNNIIDPDSPKYITIDTHAFAAALLRPLGSTHPATRLMWGGTPSSSKTGMSGVYPIIAEAYIRLAKEKGMLPREIQSILWSAIKNMFPPALRKNPGFMESIDKFLQSVDNGEISIDEARELIRAKAEANVPPPMFALDPEIVNVDMDTSFTEGKVIVLGPEINVEVAPDPENIELTNRWNALDSIDKDLITRDILWYAADKILGKYKARAEFHIQLGGYLENTNPSVVLKFIRGNEPSGKDLESISRELVDVLNQNSVMLTATKKLPNGFESINFVIKHKMADRQEIHALYMDIRSKIGLDENGKHIVQGHSTDNYGNMNIVVGSQHQEHVSRVLAEIFQGQDIKIIFDKINVAFVEKEVADGDKTSDARRKSADADYDNLQRTVSNMVEEAIRRAEEGRRALQEERGGVRELKPFYVDADGNVILVHFSTKTGLDLIDPSFYGTGFPGRERIRQINDPKNFVNRTYWALKGGGYLRERTISGAIQRYEAKLPLDSLYDIHLDPDGILATMYEKYGKNPDSFTLAEKAIKEAGYAGILTVMNDRAIAAVFHPISPHLEAPVASSSVYAQAIQTPQTPSSRGRISFNNLTGEAVITLFKNSDPTTLIHEFMGHFYLETLLLAERDGTLNEIGQKDLATLREWVGATGEFTVEQKEQIARGVEKYFMEGKAPNAELTGVFERLKELFLRIYEAIRFTDVELSDEVRATFDSWLASESEMESYRYLNGYDAFLASAEKLGVTPEEADVVIGKLRDAIREETEDIASKIVKPVVTRIKAMGNRRKELEADARKTLSDLPVYRARRMLFSVKGGFKVWREEIIDLLGEDALKVFKGAYVNDEAKAVPLSVIAEGAGYDGVADPVMALYEDLGSHPKLSEAIRRSANKVIDREIQDGLYGEGFKNLIAEAMHSDSRLMMLLMEHILTKGGDKVNFEKEAVHRMKNMKAYAENVLRGKRLNEISIRKYLAAEQRYGRAYERAIIDNDLDTAVKLKTIQAFNHAMAMTAMTIQRQAANTVRVIKKYQKRGRKTYGFPEDIIRAIDELVGNIDVRRITEGEREVIRALEQEEGEYAPETSKTLYKTELATMEVGELLAIGQRLKHLEAMGRMERLLISAGKQQLFDEFKDDIIRHLNDKFPTRNKRDSKIVKKTRDNVAKFLKRCIAEHMNVDFLVKVLDDGPDGPFRQALFMPMERGYGDMMLRQYQSSQDYMELLKKHFPRQGKELKQTRVRTHMLGREQDLTTENLITIALLYGSSEGRDRLLKGYGLDDERVVELLSGLGENELAFVEDIWKWLETFFPEANKLHMDLFQQEMKKVEAVPFRVGDIEMRGGYFPIYYDHELSTTATQEQNPERYHESHGYRSMASNYTHVRLSNVQEGAKASLFFGESLIRHISDINRDLALQRAFRDVYRILKDSDVRDQMTRIIGPEGLNQFRPWVEFVQHGGEPPVTGISKLLRYARRGATATGLALRFSPAIAQLMGFSSAAVEIGPFRVASSIMNFYLRPDQYMSNIEFVHKSSPFMKFRRQTWDRDIATMAKKMIGSGQMDRIREMGFYFIGMMDASVTIPVWLEAYHMKLEEVGHDKAVEYADQVIRQTQNVGRSIDLAGVQRHSEIMKLLTMFYSFMGTLNRMGQYELGKSIRDKDIARAGAFLLWGIMLPAIALGLIKGGAPEPEDPNESWWLTWSKWAAKSGSLYYLGTWVLVRDMISGISGYGDYEISPVTKGLRQTGRVLTDSYKVLTGEDVEDKLPKLAEGALRTLEFWFGIGTTDFRRQIGYMLDVYDGNREFVPREFMFNARPKK